MPGTRPDLCRHANRRIINEFGRPPGGTDIAPGESGRSWRTSMMRPFFLAAAHAITGFLRGLVAGFAPEPPAAGTGGAIG